MASRKTTFRRLGLRAAEPVLWYDTEFDREQEIAGMNKEMTSIKDFDVYEEKLITECTPDQLQNAISTKWVKRAKGDGVKCRVCVRGYDQEVDPDDTYARYSFTYHVETSVDFGGCTWLAHTCWRRQHGVSSRTSHGRSFCDSTG